MLGISKAIKAIDKHQYQQTHQQQRPIYTTPTKPTRYKNQCKQMMYEVYLKDLKENPQWAAYKVKHNGYGGFVFDDTES